MTCWLNLRIAQTVWQKPHVAERFGLFVVQKNWGIETNGYNGVNRTAQSMVKWISFNNEVASGCWWAWRGWGENGKMVDTRASMSHSPDENLPRPRVRTKQSLASRKPQASIPAFSRCQARQPTSYDTIVPKCTKTDHLLCLFNGTAFFFSASSDANTRTTVSLIRRRADHREDMVFRTSRTPHTHCLRTFQVRRRPWKNGSWLEETERKVRQLSRAPMLHKLWSCTNSDSKSCIDKIGYSIASVKNH